MSATLIVAALLATIACISFLAGTTHTDRTRNRAYRRLVEETRELNAMLLHSLDSPTMPSPRSSPSYEPFHPGMGRQTTLLQPYAHDLDDD
jgi:hypothetical protein